MTSSLNITSKCGNNISDCASCATFLFLTHFDIICDLLLNRRTATWNLFVNYIITSVMHAFWLVLTYDLLEDRRLDDVIIKTFFPYILILYYIKQIDSKLPRVCSVIDHRWRQNGCLNGCLGLSNHSDCLIWHLENLWTKRTVGDVFFVVFLMLLSKNKYYKTTI